MAENPEQTSGNLIPPKLDLRKSGLVKEPPQPAAASGIPSASAGLTSKRETSRIPLESVKVPAGPEAGGAPKTIRIKPATGLGAIRVGKPEGAAEAGAPAADSAAKSAAEKRTTSRISLEAVLGETAAAGGESGPRTIRLKRPGEAPALKMAGADSEAGAAGGTPTVRRTVRVKRTSVAVGGQPPSVARPEGADQPGAIAAMAAAPEKVGAVYPIAALLAVFVTLAVIWMLCAQDFGPDLSLTQLSTGALRGFDLPWPGKIVPIR